MRITPITCTDTARQAFVAAGLLRAMEVHSTSDNTRLFLNNVHIGGGVIHGDVTNEAAMLALTLSVDDGGDPRSVWPGDFCWRIDTDSLWICWTNRGETAADWRNIGGGEVSGVSFLDGGSADETDPDISDELDGGSDNPASPDISDELDGNDDI